MSPIRAEPVKETDSTKFYGKDRLNRTLIRITPYPPSFNNTAAKIIDPTTGASTCALGSHRCPKKIGSFTKNAVINLKVTIALKAFEFILYNHCLKKKIFLKITLLTKNNNNGIEAVIV